MSPPAAMCLLHADFHPMTDACRAVAISYIRTHPEPVTPASRLDYLADVERSMLDDHIREHLRATQLTPPPPQPDPATSPADTHTLERAA